MSVETVKALVEVTAGFAALSQESRVRVGQENAAKAVELRAQARQQASQAMRRYYHGQARWYEMCAYAASGEVGR